MTTKSESTILLFWDEAEVEERCVVPCWPVDANGDGFDCDSLLYGVMLEPRWFQALDVELPPFDPGNVTYSCPIHSGDHQLTGFDQNLMVSLLEATAMKCRVCGCSDYDAGPEGCAWVEDDLCSGCESNTST